MLPQSEIYTQLKNRLDSIPGIISALNLLEPPSKAMERHAQARAFREEKELESSVLLAQFAEAQKRSSALWYG